MADPSVVGSKISDLVLQESIKSYLSDESKVTILSQDIRPATKPGDNYISFVYQVAVTYSIGEDPSPPPPYEIQFIVKCIQDSEMFQALVQESRVFEREQLMYETILPALESISGHTFAPKCFYIQDKGHRLMVFNDLKEMGFKMPDRRKGMDFDHCKLLIERLAIYHASSVAFMQDKEDDHKDLLGQGMSTDPILVEFVFKSNLAKLIEVAKEWTEPEFDLIRPKLQLAMDNYLEVYKMPMQTQTDPFRVINHGDAWCNNFMFSYDDNEPTDVILLDHQMPFFSSPGYDLNYFIITSPDMDTRLNREIDLLRVYKRSFNQKVSDLGLDGHQLTTEKLQQAYEQKSIFGFTMLLTILPLIMRNVPEGGDSDDKVGNLKKMQDELFQNADFIAIAKFSLRKFQKMGTFDQITPGA